jgi:hypothetical protein
MPSQAETMQRSLELNLFFLRIMKEHALFLQLGFTQKDRALAMQAQELHRRLEALMSQAVRLSKSYISEPVMASGELFTRYTEEAERLTQHFTGIPTGIELTRQEYVVGGGSMPPPAMREEVERLNRAAMGLTRQLLAFKEQVYRSVTSCTIVTKNYPLFLDHLVREARHYLEMLQALLTSGMPESPLHKAEMEYFWNEIMGEHAQFIDGLLDPTEKALKETSRVFEAEFERLHAEAGAARSMLQMLPGVTQASETATEQLSEFKSAGTRGIITCKIRSVILPLQADHVLREAAHYLRMLREPPGM